MRRVLVLAIAFLLAGPAASLTATAQRRRPARRAPAPKTKTVTPKVTCPSELGVGVKTGERFCDVTTSRDPATGILVEIPAHRGDATLTFDLHNRQIYSEDQVKAHTAYARDTATVVVVTMDGTILDRGIVRSEFRTGADVVDWIGGGAGPGGVKAVVPTGTEPITITIPEKVDQVSIVGEKLEVVRLDGSYTYTDMGRPVAAISNVKVEYRPAPVRKRRPR
ncbi:MAG TPA: hypothetical protein VIC33_06280 [Vicinamibacterales bacterium]|jgi:hypothetical protein